MKVYNTNFLRGNQRFVVAILAGAISAIACAFAYAIIVNLLHFRSSLLYLAMAYGISYCVKTYGRGVDTKYCLIGAVFTLLSILLGGMLTVLLPLGFNLTFVPAAFMMTLSSIFSFNFNGIIEMICIAYSLYLAYYNSRIV